MQLLGLEVEEMLVFKTFIQKVHVIMSKYFIIYECNSIGPHHNFTTSTLDKNRWSIRYAENVIVTRAISYNY